MEEVFKNALKDKQVIEAFENAGWVVENLGAKEAADFWARDQQSKIEIAKAINLVPK